jgi:hypothetical protein
MEIFDLIGEERLVQQDDSIVLVIQVDGFQIEGWFIFHFSLPF